MTSLLDVVIIIDQQKNYWYSRMYNFRILGFPTICLVDTYCNPYLTYIPIPTNVDARASIRWTLNKITLAICEGCYNSMKFKIISLL